MTSHTQQRFDFDMVSLNTCIAALQPKRLRTLFRGLLMTAAQEPRHVTDIDDSGFVLMTAPIEKVADWSGVDVRTIQRCRTALAHLVEHDGGPGREASQWCFSLKNVMPANAIPWFRELVEDSRSEPRHFENSTPAFCATNPGILQPNPGILAPNAGVGAPNATPAFSSLTSMCLVLATASLASLAGSCEKFGIAMSCSSGTWDSLSLDPEALSVPEVIDSLFRLAAGSGVIDSTSIDRRRVFVAAAVASRANTPWRYFRTMLANRWHLTTEPNSEDSAKAKRLRRLADAIASGPAQTPELVAVESPKVSAGPIPEEKLAGTAFGRRLLAQRAAARHSPEQPNGDPP